MNLPEEAPAFRLKGGTLSATVLELSQPRPELIERQLADKVAQSPQLFRNAPLVLALDKLDENDGPLDMSALLAVCQRNLLHPVGVRALRPDDLAQAANLGLAVLPLARTRERPAATAAETGTPAAPGGMRGSRVVTQPVRGGQQIYARGDLILLAPVSAGAEVMADGHIHVYAPLRGRALAGVQGDATARIFCRELLAELVAVAGHYRIADDLKAEKSWGRSAQIFLRNDALDLAPL